MRVGAAATLLLALLGLTSASSVDKYTGCVEGIRTSVADLTFEGVDYSEYWPTLCTNKLVVTSIWAAAKRYCTPKEIKEGYKELNGYCLEYGLVTLTPYAKISPILTDQYIDSLPIAEFSDIKALTPFNSSVLISEDLYKAGRDSWVCIGYAYILPMVQASFTDNKPQNK